MSESKISKFSEIMEEYSPEQKMLELKKSTMAEIGSVILESSRKSKFMAGLKIKTIKKEQNTQNIDSNSIKLLRGPVLHKRELPTKQGNLLMYINQVCCFGFGSDRQQVKCSLQRNILTIQQSPSNKKYVCFDSTNIVLTSKQSTQFQLYIPKTEVYFHFKAESEYQRDSWVSTIEKCISRAYSYGKHFEQVISNAEFQYKQWVIQSEFVQSCNSGDIILFKSSHTYGKLQQVLTFSQYDHVGIILKNKKNQVIIFQSNSSEGVSFIFWNQMIRFKLYQGIPRLAWRRLKMERSERDIATMQDFVMANLHKQFEMNMNKFLRFQSTIHKSQQEEKNRTYFCSQLVAAFYKKLGLLDQKKATTQYWPVSFSDAKNIQLLRGRLEPQKIIVFQQQAIQKRRHK